ncbi:hypothetical protein [Pararhizobium haloflavum]|uniref:hypothetical protein n=1 Tax=Pararhizobium haloflavum TaxID=2037914 RepID=UPI001FE1B10F|nr:hypothetical protein [Pararhizobium haloflavum]
MNMKIDEDLGEITIDPLARRLYDRCHPDDSFDEMRQRARFSKEDRGLLRDWRAAARCVVQPRESGSRAQAFAAAQK